MTTKTFQYILAWLFLLMAGGTAMAQNDYNPDNPPEPQALNRITVAATPVEAGYASGGGQYALGTKVTIRTSAKSSDFKFLYWMENGEVYSDKMSFTYTVESGNRTFTAVYEYSPESPAEPTLVSKRRLYLNCEPEDACSFNRTSGAKAEVGTSVNVRAYANQGFAFKGWYRGSEKLSDSNPFYYSMPDEDVTLTARYEFDPDSPGEPVGSQDDVDNSEPGDVNCDGLITIADVTALVNIILGKDNVEPYVYDHKAANVDKDDSISIADVTALVNMILGK